MSAEATVAFYGVRFPVSEDEITALEERSHPRILEARQNGLKYYWGNFAAPNEEYALFIGDNLGILGVENERRVQLSPEELLARVQETNAKLKRAAIMQSPMLYLQWQPDA